ncbi:hypothetical protein [Hansschlegelia plantiphila]|uniref:Invasion associated locus B family protein n=1 Tax=Hansschlegelia plantiphila TaxID=374655 RepID=A0A9W6MWB4_9HYPH|nr:hypothetical protein [Hansschlegelia plantiphila]GLK68878.1 hypothetical protein GCM10008179_25160 [Hansschlegelia plantiphila]
MTDRLRSAVFLAATLIAFTAGGAAHAQTAPAATVQPTSIGEFKDWTAYAAPVKGGKVCYALANPEEGRRRAAKPSNAFFFVSNRPQEGIVNEVSVTPGFTLKADSAVEVDIDGVDFKMAPRGDGAFMNTNEEQAAMVKAMREGRRDMKIKLTPTRGRATTQVYSLSGVAGAIDKINAECRPAAAKAR